MTEIEVKKPKFKANHFGVASYQRNEWHLELQPPHEMADVSDPILWKDILGREKPGDTVEAFKPDSGAWAKFVILESRPGFIRLGNIEGYTPAEVKEPEGQLAPKWNVGKRSFDVIRKSDGYVMAKDFQTKTSAVAWINDHMQKMAA